MNESHAHSRMNHMTKNRCTSFGWCIRRIFRNESHDQKQIKHHNTSNQTHRTYVPALDGVFGGSSGMNHMTKNRCTSFGWCIRRIFRNESHDQKQIKHHNTSNQTHRTSPLMKPFQMCAVAFSRFYSNFTWSTYTPLQAVACASPLMKS
jgi:hypothetical protein